MEKIIIGPLQIEKYADGSLTVRVAETGEEIVETSATEIQSMHIPSKMKEQKVVGGGERRSYWSDLNFKHDVENNVA